jgi:hypothetical protein
LGKVWPMHFGFFVRGEKVCVEYRVDAPLHGKFQSIVDSGHHLVDLKRAMPLGRKLGGWLIDMEILPF